MHTGIQQKNWKEKDHLEDLDIDEKYYNGSEKQDRWAWTEFIWLRIKTNGSLLLPW